MSTSYSKISPESPPDFWKESFFALCVKARQVRRPILLIIFTEQLAPLLDLACEQLKLNEDFLRQNFLIAGFFMTEPIQPQLNLHLRASENQVTFYTGFSTYDSTLRLVSKHVVDPLA
jgi:hypothetical protein